MENVDKVSHIAHEALDKLTHASNQAADHLDEKSQQLKNIEQRLIRDCQVYIRDNPVSTVGIAVAAGFLLSRVLSSR